MPRDPRPYLTYPVGYTAHPRWELHSDAAFRALHEMQDYTRGLLLDGRINRRVAERRWSPEVIAELLAGIDDRPLLEVDGDVYVLRSYAEHQMTAADVDKLRADKSRAGQASARARTAARTGVGTPVEQADGPADEAEGAAPKPKSTRGTRVPKDFAITDELREWAALNAPHVDVDKKLGEWIDYWTSVAGKPGFKRDWVATWRNGMRKQEEFALRDIARFGAPATTTTKKERFK